MWMERSRAAVRTLSLFVACGALAAVGCDAEVNIPNSNGNGSSAGTNGGGTSAGTADGGASTTGVGTSTTGMSSTNTTGSTTTGSGTTATNSGGTNTGSGTTATSTTGSGTTGSDTTGTSTTGGSTATTGTTGTTGSSTTGTTGTVEGGDCCPDGNCLCHGPAPTEMTDRNGPFNVERYDIESAVVFYPTDAEPPFAATTVSGGFTNTGPEMYSWGEFYASHGIVAAVVWTGALDVPAQRGRNLVQAVEELKQENNNSSSPLSGKLSGRYGVSGYSMGGGGTILAAGDHPDLRSAVGMAAWTTGVSANGVTVPTLVICGAADAVAPCSMSESAYNQIDDSTPKMWYVTPGISHLSWFGPDGSKGGHALAFHKLFLEGDERWRSVLLSSDATTNIQ